MNSQDAKAVLGLYRPGSPDARDPQVAEALEQAQHDPELGQWLEQTCAFHTAMREKFRQIPVPPDLKQAILARNTIVRPIWWQQPAWLAAAAAILVFLGLAAFWLQRPTQDGFDNYRSRMVSAALRLYSMDIVTNDLNEVRHYLAQHGTPADYALPEALGKLTVTGGGCLDWQNHPVSMVCFDRGDKKMLFLFVMARTAVKDPPPSVADRAKVNKLLTKSWTRDDKTYLLAGPEDSSLLRRQL